MQSRRLFAAPLSLSRGTNSDTLTRMDLLINIDVPNLDQAVAFYEQAFGLAVTRRLGAEAAELGGLPVRLYLLQKPTGSVGAGTDPRRYDRHWTPVHVDVVVDDIKPRFTAPSPPRADGDGNPGPRLGQDRGAV